MAQILAAYENGQGCLLMKRLVNDIDTPVSAYLKLEKLGGPSFLLESIEGGHIRGRYSFIGVQPDLVWRLRDGRAEINRTVQNPEGGSFVPCPLAPRDSLRALIAESALPAEVGAPPLAAGLFGAIGYEFVHSLEAVAQRSKEGLALPDACLLRPTIVAAFDSLTQELTLVTPIRPQKGITATQAYEAAQLRLQKAEAAMQGAVPASAPHVAPPQERQPQAASLHAAPSAPRSSTGKEKFLGMVIRAKEYIRAGDIFQVVLSQRQTIPFALPSFAFYRALRRLNPSPFMFYYDFGGGLQVVGASPEILVRLRDGIVTVRPIAGTRPRGTSLAQDQVNEAELKQDPKERAEHLMLLDLGRNDVGRVAKEGSVRVTAQAIVERYSHVMHLVSNVEGDLAAGLSALDAFFAGFPAGTVSGAPKVRAMQIIDELEPERRGFYAGGVGYFGADGNMDTAICLRTAVLLNGQLHVQAGAGIVYDSDPEKEWEETLAKAQAIVRAAELAHRYATGLDG